jgi:nitrogen regulation protein NR(I)
MKYAGQVHDKRSMPSSAHILLIEDDTSLANNLRDVLKEDGFKVTLCSRGDEGLRRANNDDCDVVLTDLRLPGLGGLELVRQLHETQPRLPVVLMTAHGTIEIAIEATKQGAYEYLQKPFEMRDLLALLHRAVEASRLMRDPVALPDASVESGTALVGTSRAMQDVCKAIGRVAAKPVTVLIRGETGTGKELIARAIYQHSTRAKAPFIAINCAAIPENLLESELFGHERGAFTGADQRRIGRFEQANKGTLFLDEIGDLPTNTQVKLLRVLQQQTFQRVGGAEAISVDVRVIAATHRNLEAMIHHGKFREDLFHRLNVVSMQLPPLRERREDIPVLVHHFLRKYAGDFDVETPTISSDALAALQADSWPGNVRELENMTRRLLLGAGGLSINAETVRQTLAARHAESGPSGNSFARFAGELLARAQTGDLTDVHARMMAEAEREVITQAIALADGNQAKAARWLGLSRFTLREKLKQLGLHPDSSDAGSEAAE